MFKTENSKYLENSEILNKEFPNTDQIIIMLEIEDNQLGNVIEFENYLNTLDVIKFVKGIENSSLSLPMNIKLEDTSSVITIEDKTYAILTIFPTENFNFSSLNSIENYLDDKEFTYYLSGDLYMQNKIFYYLLFVLLTIPPIAMVILFTIFRTQIKSTKATFLSVLPAGIAALWSLGIAGLLGNKVSMLTVLAPVFTVIIGSADGLHFMSHLQENLKEGLSIKKSLKHTLKMIGIPMVITTITSVAGFISLIFI